MVGVGGGYDARPDGDGVAGEPGGVAAAVETLLVVQDEGDDVRELGGVFDDRLAEHRVLADAVPLRGGEAALLGEHRIGDPDLAHVVKQRACLDARHLVSAEAPCAGRWRRPVPRRDGCGCGCTGRARLRRRRGCVRWSRTPHPSASPRCRSSRRRRRAPGRAGSDCRRGSWRTRGRPARPGPARSASCRRRGRRPGRRWR